MATIFRKTWFSFGSRDRAAQDSARTGPAALFDPSFVAQLERLRIAALRAAGGGLRAGHRLGAYKGGQLEFHGHRDYSPGDELRYLDWNSYARLGRPFIKEFAREEAGCLHLLLDSAPSMALGNPSKFDFARRTAALFAHVALASHDRVFVWTCGSNGRSTAFPKPRSKASIRDFLEFLSTLKCAGDTAAPDSERQATIATAIDSFAASRATRGRLIVSSDFWIEESSLTPALSRAARAGFDISLLHVLAPGEVNPDFRGQVELRPLSGQRPLDLWLEPERIQAYAHELERHRAGIERSVRKRGGNYLFAESGMPLESVLLATLRQRRWLV